MFNNVFLSVNGVVCRRFQIFINKQVVNKPTFTLMTYCCVSCDVKKLCGNYTDKSPVVTHPVKKKRFE